MSTKIQDKPFKAANNQVKMDSVKLEQLRANTLAYWQSILSLPKAIAYESAKIAEEWEAVEQERRLTQAVKEAATLSYDKNVLTKDN
ncbi:hypothetical protein G6F37_006237 [Rhizopus arrhizus]|nr:hypothetical protein G6F38_008205 [Rhizopus arrhizus]KAG1157959.1 hypothetical protein G6F37_006237 [Rhizopus arrhizus]